MRTLCHELCKNGCSDRDAVWDAELNHVLHGMGGSVVQWLERWTRNSMVASLIRGRRVRQVVRIHVPLQVALV